MVFRLAKAGLSATSRRPAPGAARLRLVPAPPPPHKGAALALASTLLREGLVETEDLIAALRLQAQLGSRLDEVLIARGLIDATALADVAARHWQAPQADLDRFPPDPALIDRIGAETCLREGLLPWRETGGVTLIATPWPEAFAEMEPMLTRAFGPVAMTLIPRERLDAAVLDLRGAELDTAARQSVAEPESCRTWGSPRHLRNARIGLAVLVALTILRPIAVLWVLTIWATVSLALATVLKTAAIFGALHRRTRQDRLPLPSPLPRVSILVALFHERDIAGRLVRRLSRLDYPRECLEILLVVERNDIETQTALREAVLPGWMRVVIAPDGPLLTKPRALNHALKMCRGEIVGVYDAEDAPEPDQIRRVVRRFANRGPNVVCLQGVLDFYNPRTNWLSRCFTMEYASWFRIILPGMERLGLPIPLGGTTLFFRRKVLEELGAWDACNVTEDADLGIRLSRHGYRTELIDTTTFEEANCRPLPWIRQRSRWLKGYFMTYAVHMRDPALLLRQLGWWRFAGFQVFFLTTLSQYVLAPVLWTFWLVPLGVPHPVITALPPGLYQALFGLFLFTEVLLIALTLVAMRLTPNRLSPLWAPMLHFYFPLGSLASYKAIRELIDRPFWWDKTSHGQHDPD